MFGGRLLAGQLRGVVGVVVDVYHVWWIDRTEEICARARIVGYHVNDWVVPSRDPVGKVA